MSNQDAKATAQQVLRDLLAAHPPGFVVMVLRNLNRILRSTKDLTTCADKTQATSGQNPPTLENAGDK